MNEIPIINLGLDFMKEVLREVYPEGHEIAREANIKFYAGVRWGRDFRLNELPREEDGSLKVFPESQLEDFKNMSTAAEGRELRLLEKEISNLSDVMDDVAEFAKLIRKVTNK